MMIRTATILLLLAPALAAQDPPHHPVNGIDCFGCHVLHGAPGAHYTNVAGAINLCLSCHNSLGVLPVETHAPGGDEIACTVCHEPHVQEQTATHGSTFSFLVRDSIATPNSGPFPVKLMGPTGPNSFADADSVYDGVCEVCHTATAYHRNNPGGLHDHNPGADCRSCHPHTAGFRPSGGDCLGCHSREQPPLAAYRRQVVEYNGDGNGDFVRVSHHVDDGSGNEAVTAGDCVACHDQAQHQFHPDPEVLLREADGGASIQFDGGAASLTPFCLGCHDGDHAGGNPQPFSTPGAPADIDQHWSTTARHAADGTHCFDCHDNGHGSDNPVLLGALEEAQCLGCHGPGGVAAVDIAAEFGRTYTHPVGATSLVHAAGEDPLTMARHVECEDCHDPHAANTLLGAPVPGVPGGMLAVDGVDGDGLHVLTPSSGYEVCYKCHAGTNPGNPALPRQFVESDVSVEFDPGYGSFHPVETVGKSGDVPSLLPPWTTSSRLGCEDCHAGDGPVSGPHGSEQEWILKRRYDTDDYAVESAEAYALCYGCHSRLSIWQDVSFPKHWEHVIAARSPCSACHDAHGGPDTHLINIRTDIATPNQFGQFGWTDLGDRHGSCNLDCHGYEHEDETY